MSIRNLFKSFVNPSENPTDSGSSQSHSFAELGLIDSLLQAVAKQGYTQPTPIQVQSIPHILKGKDLLGCAQTGTGKTAAFALPTIQRILEIIGNAPQRSPIRVLVLTPTRELAIQIDESFRVYGSQAGIKHAVVFGGVGQGQQEKAIDRSPHILVATPGRLLDLMNQRIVTLNKLDIFILDEADRMLDMGFIHDVKRVIKALPPVRQTLFFSATMPPEIQGLADSILKNPVKVSVSPVSSAATTVTQHVYFVDQPKKKDLLASLLQDQTISRALVFARTKHGANKIVEHLIKCRIRAEAIHGNKSQTARQKALENFKAGTTRVLVASDLASRGIDIDEITHVINFELPNVPETYVHRIGRTGRAGLSGIALSFCDINETPYLRDIERMIKQKIAVIEDHPFPAQNHTVTETPDAVHGRRSNNRRPQQQRGGPPRAQQNRGRRR